MTRLAVVCRALATISPHRPEPSAELCRALTLVAPTLDGATVAAAGYGLATLIAPLAAVTAGTIAGWGPRTVPGVVGVALVVAVAGVHVVHRLPVVLAAVRRARTLGNAPALIGRIVLRMRVEPAVERAAAFGAESGTGPLAASLGTHLDGARGRPRSGLSTFAEEWADRLPPLRRACSLIVAAGAATPGERERTLDRALNTVVAGVRDDMSAFAASLRGPTTALYAFGVLLPLALVAVLPAAGVAGVAVPTVAIVVVYDLALPAVLLIAGSWLLARRPVAFPPPPVPATHPARPDRRWPRVVPGPIFGAVAWVVVDRVVGHWAAPIAGVGIGVGVVAIALARPAVLVRKRVRAVERGLPDLLSVVGRRVAGGAAVETALAAAGETLSGPIVPVVESAVARQRRLRVDLETALLGPNGALATVPSPRVRSAGELLAVAADQGRPAGRALVDTAEHVDTLAEIEATTVRDLARVTGTLRSTAALFGPLVAGTTVALASGMARLGGADSLRPGTAGGATGTTGTTIPTDVLGPVIGVYVLLLAVVLTTVGVGLERGLDRAELTYRVGRALVTATTIFCVSFALASRLV